jgi:hypothetical protein
VDDSEKTNFFSLFQESNHDSPVVNSVSKICYKFLSASVEAVTAMFIKIQAFWDMMPFRFINFYGILGDLAASIFRVYIVEDSNKEVQ